MQWVSSYFDQETRVGWFSTYDGCNDEDGNEDPVPIPGCWGSSNKFLKHLLYLTSEWGKKRFLFLLPVDRDTHIYFSSNLRHPPCALCGSNLIIFLSTAIFSARAGAGVKILWCFLVQVNAMVKLTPHAPNPKATDKYLFGFLLQFQVDINSQPVAKYERSSKLLYFEYNKYLFCKFKKSWKFSLISLIILNWSIHFLESCMEFKRNFY